MSEQEKVSASRILVGWVAVPVGFVLLAMLIWWPADDGVRDAPERRLLPSQPAAVPTPDVMPPSARPQEPRARRLVEILNWVPSGFPLVVAMDLGSTRRFAWTQLFRTIFETSSLRRHLDVLQLDGDGFEWMGIGAVPTAPLAYWSGKTVQFSIVPHVLFLRGREGRLQILRRFWKAENTQDSLQVGQYQLVFPIQREPHLVIAGFKADVRTPLDMVEGKRRIQSFCAQHECQHHIFSINPWAHFVAAYVPPDAWRISGDAAVRAVWVVGEWNMDGLLLQARVLLSGHCPEALPRMKTLLNRQAFGLRVDGKILQRIHMACADEKAMHVSLFLATAEIQRQWIVFGFQPTK